MALNDGRFLHLLFDCRIDQNDKRLSIRSSKIAYQLDVQGHQQLFRFDYEKEISNQYPSSHVHVYGKWEVPEIEKERPLSKVHIPVLRSSIEASIRLIVEEFGTTTNEPDALVWQEILDTTEFAFLKRIRTKN
jgi:hypothetical protein